VKHDVFHRSQAVNRLRFFAEEFGVQLGIFFLELRDGGFKLRNTEFGHFRFYLIYESNDKFAFVKQLNSALDEGTEELCLLFE
jgi:hypothetical protein